MSCPDLCTAAKCAELEARIGALEQALELLEASFESHVAQDIPTAHDYTPNVIVTINEQNNYIFVDVEVDGVGDSDSFKNPHVESNLKISGFIESNKLYLFIADGESEDSEVIDINLNEPDDLYVENIELFSALDGNTLGITATLYMSDGSDRNSNLTTVELPVFEPFVVVDVFPTGDGTFVITVTVNGDSDSDTFTINIPDMNCDEFLEELRFCCSELSNALNSLSTQLSNTESILNQSIEEVHREVTIDITGEITEGDCTTKLRDENGDFVFDENDEHVRTDPYYEVTNIETYSNKSFNAINDAILLLDGKISKIHDNLCQSMVEPKLTVPVDQFLPTDCSDELLPKREEYLNESLFFDAVKKFAADYLTNETIKKLFLKLAITPGSVASFGVTAGASIIIQYLIESTFRHQKFSFYEVCNKLDDLEDPEVVSIVASDKVIARAEGKFLVLHFVTQANYPKRSRSSSYWPVQIPAAKDEYNWNEDFINLRWNRGNQYAELRFNEFANPVSGFFSDENTANTYFDRVLRLTTATEKNRVIPKHKTPQTNVIARVTRPYRAFISSVNSTGQVVCHVKYVPTDENGNAL